MLKIGATNTLKILRQIPFGLILDSTEGDILLPNKFVKSDMEIGQEISVFIYRDFKDRLTATTQTPKAEVGEMTSLMCVDTTNFGAFLDWGLDKDLLVPKSEMDEPMVKGRKYVVRILHDHKSDRIIASSKIKVFFDRETAELERGQKVEMMIYRKTPLGYTVLVDGKYEGMLFDNQIFKMVRPGDTVNGYIKGVREDGKLDLTLQEEGYQAVVNSTDDIIEKLEEAGGFLPYHDKSNAEEIKEIFQMSKRTFKKVIGGLYKSGKIEIDEEGIRLKG
ncbi:S1 RNA-binding domain-containing protein [Persicobacter sp. CCB-QB2]|uniref:CvfB family protein n=1 Tax=Persicobacter sp. CCB-QB2 TaxID=1561025 RepID=UPI0006A9EFB5|nr:S1-like domain-containing RNA-binding protein [Persicobacter sp. CCB-QB2]